MYHLFLDGCIPAKILDAEQYGNGNSWKPAFGGFVNNRTLQIVVQRGNYFHAAEEQNQQDFILEVRQIDEKSKAKLERSQQLEVLADVQMIYVPTE